MDVYAVGHILAELLLGHTPYLNQSASQVIESKLGVDRHPFQSPILHGPVGRVVQQAIANDPRHRYRSAEAMLRDIQAFAAQQAPPSRSTIAARCIPEPTTPEMPVITPNALTRTRG